jgi:hypothetical protein
MREEAQHVGRGLLALVAAVSCVVIALATGSGCKHRRRGEGPVQQSTNGEARAQGPDASPLRGGRSDNPWTVAELLDEEQRPLLDRCRELRREFLQQANRSCEKPSDCLATNGCVAVNKESSELMVNFERRWLSLGCSARPFCKNARMYCDGRVCGY